jgi:hypothetical protein
VTLALWGLANPSSLRGQAEVTLERSRRGIEVGMAAGFPLVAEETLATYGPTNRGDPPQVRHFPAM